MHLNEKKILNEIIKIKSFCLQFSKRQELFQFPNFFFVGSHGFQDHPSLGGTYCTFGPNANGGALMRSPACCRILPGP